MSQYICWQSRKTRSGGAGVPWAAAAGKAHPSRAATRAPVRNSLALGVEPVRSDTDIHDEGDLERGRTLHVLAHQRAHAVLLVGRNLEDELVVHLEQHAAPELALDQGVVDPDHRDLDQIGGRPLERRILRVAL